MTEAPRRSPRRAATRRPVRLIAIGALLLAAGCADFSGIAPASSMRTAESLGLAADRAATEWPATEWWRGYGDARLDALVERALADSPTVAIAAARVARAGAMAEMADAALGPQVTGVIDSTRQRYTETGLIPPPRAGSIGSSNFASLNLAWELDLFGRNRSLLDAAIGRTRAARADLQAARVLLASQVVRAYFELARLTEQRTLAQRVLEHRAKTVELLRMRVDAGIEGLGALRSAEGAPAEAHRQIALADERIALARGALAALTAQPVPALASLAPALPAGRNVRAPETVPADLLGRRADVVAARWRVEAALRQRDAATAQFYPNVNLAAFAGMSSIGVGRWFESGSLTYGVGPAIRLPIFDSGRLRANLRGETAEADLAVHGYNATLVEAVREVADHVASLRALVRQAEAQRAGLAADEQAHALALERFRAGLGNYLGVLAAQAPVLDKQAIGIDQRARALDLDAGLARALGGGAPDGTTQ